MVEMNEAASIINNLTPRSLVLFDELGRGTSTYDGISIAWSIVEYIHENRKAHARTLFATHYHELNEMENLYSRIHNYNVSVLEQDGKVVFLRKLAKGGSEHSFGIHVAAMAGMPKAIVNRSEVILRQLEEEKKHEELGNGQAAGARKTADKGDQLNFFRLDFTRLKSLTNVYLSENLQKKELRSVGKPVIRVAYKNNLVSVFMEKSEYDESDL